MEESNNNVAGSESMEELLRQILEADKKEVKYAKRAALFMMGLFIVFLVAAIILVPKVVVTLSNVNTAVISASETMKKADETVKSADEALDNINKMSGSITKTSDNMNTMITDNSKSLTEAVENMNSIDFEGLNKAIQDLQDAVGPFAKFMNKFK
ncbi:MAG: hypothetical protein K6G42_02075 [Lachnospiraceae bacterium]|nr:hypothetical protein [Lachnospiraceae bacterium]